MLTLLSNHSNQHTLMNTLNYVHRAGLGQRVICVPYRDTLNHRHSVISCLALVHRNISQYCCQLDLNIRMSSEGEFK